MLSVAAHPGDDLAAAGGTLAVHAARGDQPRALVVLACEAPQLAAARAAAEQLGLDEPEFWELDPDPEGEDLATLERRFQVLLEELSPELVYAPSPFERDRSRARVGRALATALSRAAARRVFRYATDAGMPITTFVDTSAQLSKKREALSRMAGALPGMPNGLPGMSIALDRFRTRAVGQAGLQSVEGFQGRSSDEPEPARAPQPRREDGSWDPELPRATAVVSTWNKREDLRENLQALLAQSLPFASIVVVDNASSDGTPEMVAEEFPEVHLVVMPHSRYGACETFNIGFACSTTELTAILDDDIVMPPEWLAATTRRMLDEPPSTAIVSTKIIEPGMPESYKSSPAVNTERYMSTFRGCASLARSHALAEAHGYDERLFIYGNERDLTARLLNLGYRVLQFPAAHVFHKTPFGIKMGKRSLYYHARNAWLGMLKYAPLSDLLAMPFLVLRKVLLRRERTEHEGEVTDATGTIGIARSLRETPGAFWVLFKAGLSVLYNVPYCLRRRQPVHAEDFELPLK